MYILINTDNLTLVNRSEDMEALELQAMAAKYDFDILSEGRELEKYSSKELLMLYKNLNGGEGPTKFSDKQTGMMRVWNMLISIDVPEGRVTRNRRKLKDLPPAGSKEPIAKQRPKAAAQQPGKREVNEQTILKVISYDNKRWHKGSWRSQVFYWAEEQVVVTVKEVIDWATKNLDVSRAQVMGLINKQINHPTMPTFKVERAQ